MNQKLKVGHKKLNAFNLMVPARPAPTTNHSTIRSKKVSLRADHDTIVFKPTNYPKSALTY